MVGAWGQVRRDHMLNFTVRIFKNLLYWSTHSGCVYTLYMCLCVRQGKGNPSGSKVCLKLDRAKLPSPFSLPTNMQSPPHPRPQGTLPGIPTLAMWCCLSSRGSLKPRRVPFLVCIPLTLRDNEDIAQELPWYMVEGWVTESSTACGAPDLTLKSASLIRAEKGESGPRYCWIIGLPPTAEFSGSKRHLVCQELYQIHLS